LVSVVGRAPIRHISFFLETVSRFFTLLVILASGYFVRL
jgi:hypothetical protein